MNTINIIENNVVFNNYVISPHTIDLLEHIDYVFPTPDLSNLRRQLFFLNETLINLMTSDHPMVDERLEEAAKIISPITANLYHFSELLEEHYKIHGKIIQRPPKEDDQGKKRPVR